MCACSCARVCVSERACECACEHALVQDSTYAMCHIGVATGLGATAGLGFGSASEGLTPEEESAFNAFRKMRSGHYHEVLLRAD